ncbi:myosin heavy chain, non-muscle-like isoform X2 [Rhodamnia argentea]|uniref:FRIGIDA-like protein n=1 Tax=Rhodamnia argentea TaxID=178133 RepID=A0A8B8MXH5_9MYRT|nr:myosin heavy chain, non-muscle-like isoform X2 [Rhodamnia argentea]
MEKVSEKLKQAELKKEGISEAYEQVHAQASNLLSFALMWKDLEEHFDGIQRSLECRSEQLLERERSLEERRRVVESKEGELCSLQRRIEECEGEIGGKTRELTSVKEQVKRLCDERESEEKRLVLTRGELSDCVSLIRDKEEELSSLRKSMEECVGNYSSKKVEMDLLQQKVSLLEKKVGQLQISLEENARELDLEREKLESTRSSHKKLCGEVDLKRLDLSMVENLLEDRYETACTRENQLSSLEHSIEELDRVIVLKQGELQSLEDEINDGCLELQVKEEELGRVKKCVEESTKALESKESLLHSTKALIKENNEKLESKQKQYDAIEKLISDRSVALDSKEKVFRFIEMTIGKLSEDLKSKEGHLEGIRKCIEQLEEEMKSKNEELASVEGKERKVGRSLEYICRELSTTKRSIKDLDLELESKRKQLESIEIQNRKSAERLQLKEQEYASIQSSILECSLTLESEKKQLDLMQKSMAECSQELEFRKGQLDQIEERSKKGRRHLDLKEKHLRALDLLTEECCKILEMRKKDCEVQRNELELRKERLDLIDKALETRTRELELRESFNALSGLMTHALANVSASASEVNSQPGIGVDGKNLLMFLGQQFKEHDRAFSKALEIIQTSTDAAKLVLDGIEGFYPQDSSNGDGLDIGIIRRVCIFLLESIIKFSAKVKPQVREAARKLAFEWKAKLNVLPSPENYLEIWGFLQLLVAYKLGSDFDANEIQNLVNFVLQLRKGHGLRQLLGSSDAQPGSLRSTQQWHIKTEESEHCIVHNADDSSGGITPPPTGSVGGTLQFLQTELLTEDHATLEEISDVLQSSSDPAELILYVIEGSHRQFSNSMDMNLDTDHLRSQIFLLEQLIKVSPSTTNEVKKEAMNLAIEWKMKLTEKAESSLEVSRFLHFLAAFKLVSSFNENEILNLADRVSLNDNAPLLRQALGLASRVTASTLASSSGVHLQPHRERKRIASGPAIDQQSEQHLHKCRYLMKNPVHPVNI